jgi:SAM-dependent methyltransferase
MPGDRVTGQNRHAATVDRPRVRGDQLRSPVVNDPALWGARRRVLDALARLKLARPAVRLYELALAARSAALSRSARDAGALPLPPARLRAQAGPRHADVRFFLESGRRHADLVRRILRDDGEAIEELEAVLDWGCGCGRVLRHWSSLPHTRVFGSDINPRMVAWCDDNLPFAHVSVNDVAPPLPYEEASFDFVYAFSVMTHLPEQLQHAWIDECRRVLRPGGRLLFSALGEYYLTRQRLTDSERQAFVNGKLVVLYEDAPGTSLCSAYHPHEYVRHELAHGFQLSSFLPAADDGRHDLYLLRKPAESSIAVRKP